MVYYAKMAGLEPVLSERGRDIHLKE